MGRSSLSLGPTASLSRILLIALASVALPRLRLLLYLIPIFVHHLAVLLHAAPFRLAIPDINDALGVEHVTLRLEGFPSLWRVDALDQRREQQDHVPPFIHDRRSTECALDLAGQMVRLGLLRGIVPAEVVVSVGEADVALMEDGCPLKRCPVKPLACRAVAVLGRQRLLPAQMILDLAAMAFSTPFDRRFALLIFIVVVDCVRISVFPLVLVPMSRAATLMLVRLCFTVYLMWRHVGVRRLLAGVKMRKTFS